MENRSKRKSKKIMKTITVIPILLFGVCFTQQSDVKKLKEFYITTIEKGSVNTSKPLSEQRESIRVRKKLNSTGTFHVEWYGDQITITIYYRDNKNNDMKNTRVLRTKFPFKRNGRYQIKGLIYSSSKGTNALYRLDEKEITHQLIDQELYIFRGEDLNSGYLLRSIFTNINILVKSNSKGRSSYQPKVKNLEIYLEDVRFVYHIKIEEEMFDKSGLGTIWVVLIFMLTMFSNLSAPTPAFLIFSEYFKEHQRKMTFIAIQLYQLCYALSFLTLLKFTFGLVYVIALVVIPIAFLATRIVVIPLSLKNIQNGGETFKGKVYLAVVFGAYLGWIIALCVNSKLFIRAFSFCMFLAVIDLIFLRRLISLRIKVACIVYPIVLLQIIPTQLFVYGGYTFCFWMIHRRVPPSIFSEFILPDLGLGVLVFLLFHLRFRLPKKFRRMIPRKIEEVGYTSIDSTIVPNFCSYSSVEDVDFDYNSTTYQIDNQRNVPVFNLIPKERSPWPGFKRVKIFHFNSTNPMTSKDYVVAGTLESKKRPVLRYASGKKKHWDFILRDIDEEVRLFSFIQHIWIENQERRDMVGAVHNSNKKGKLISLSTRKVILNVKFDRNPNLGDFENSKNITFGLFGRQRIPSLILPTTDSLSLWTAKYRQNESRLTTSTEKKFFKEVDEEVDRRLLGRKECAVFQDLVAVKFIWVDQEDYEREYINKSKYQFILIYKIDENESHDGLCVKTAGCLATVTEKVLSAYKIDYFFFVDRDTLAMIMQAKIYLVDWKQDKVKKCIEIVDLYTPLLKKGVEEQSIFASYWYDRARRLVKFSVGTITGGCWYGREDINRYITDVGLTYVSYYYSGWFLDSVFYDDTSDCKLLFSERGRSGGSPALRFPLKYDDDEPQALELNPEKFATIRGPQDIFFEDPFDKSD